jgi:hypothetical protein
LKGFHLHVPQNPLYLQANSGEQQHFNLLTDDDDLMNFAKETGCTH